MDRSDQTQSTKPGSDRHPRIIWKPTLCRQHISVSAQLHIMGTVWTLVSPVSCCGQSVWAVSWCVPSSKVCGHTSEVPRVYQRGWHRQEGTRAAGVHRPSYDPELQREGHAPWNTPILAMNHIELSLFGKTMTIVNIVDCVPRVHHVRRKWQWTSKISWWLTIYMYP